MNINTVFKNLVGVSALVLSSLSYAGVDTETDSNEVILAGHDAVAYFTQGKPVLGVDGYTAIHNDAIYRFSSAENRDTFKQNPKKKPRKLRRYINNLKRWNST